MDQKENGVRPKEYSIAIKPDFETAKNIDRKYSNYAAVSHDQYSFSLTFCETRLDSIAEESLGQLPKNEEGSYIVKVPIVAQILIPIDMMPAFIEALKVNYQKCMEKKSKSDAK
jgi:hypothetical protein